MVHTVMKLHDIFNIFVFFLVLLFSFKAIKADEVLTVTFIILCRKTVCNLSCNGNIDQVKSIKFLVPGHREIKWLFPGEIDGQ